MVTKPTHRKVRDVWGTHVVWAYTGNKLLVISVANLYNSKEQGQAWIDEYIPKVGGSVNK